MKQTMILITFALFPLWFQPMTMAQSTHKATDATDPAVRIISSANNINGHPLTPRPVNEVLKDSIFGKDQPPESMLEGEITYYDPVPLMLVSSVYSRSPGRDDHQYTQINLPPLENSDICPNPMKAFVKLSKQENPYTFVILPGAYATWKRGSFNNKTMSVLNKQFNDPNIIAFAGYLSPPFLRGVCNKIPWDSISIARDLYSRLGIYLSDEIQADPATTGLIGFSGGAGLALIMLSEDASVSQNQEEKRLFGLGGTSFSPTLHGRTIFHNLDAVVGSIDHPKALTDWTNLGNLAASGVQFWESSWKQLSKSHEDDSKALRERAFNEFSVIDLEDILKAVGVDTDNIFIHWGEEFPKRHPGMAYFGINFRTKLSYMDVFINTGLRLDSTNECPEKHTPSDSSSDGLGACQSIIKTPNNLENLYDDITDIKPHLAAIDRPALIYFSQDDPVLSSYDGSGQPPVITEILEEAQNNPNITVFNPKYGGHIGAFLDPIFEALIRAFFQYKTPSEATVEHP